MMLAKVRSVEVAGFDSSRQIEPVVLAAEYRLEWTEVPRILLLLAQCWQICQSWGFGINH